MLIAVPAFNEKFIVEKTFKSVPLKNLGLIRVFSEETRDVDKENMDISLKLVPIEQRRQSQLI